MDNLMINKLRDIMETSDSIGIAVGRGHGIDEMGAALSLYLALSQAGKKVTIATPEDPLVEVSSLVGIDKVKKGFDAEQGDLTVSFPYKEGEIEKISYTLENGKLNILVKAGTQGLSFDQNDIEYKRGSGAPKTVFVVGTPRLSDLGRVFSPEALKNSTVVNIDYREDNQGYGDILLVDKNLSSVSEMAASLLFSLGLKIDTDIASNLMSGIISGTENFQSPKTSSLAFEMAAVLMKNGAVRQTRIAKKPDFLDNQDAYSFFTPAKKPHVSSFSKTAIGTEEKRQDKKDAVSIKDFGMFPQGVKKPSEPTDENPPDDWLAPKIYKGSTAI